MELEESFSGCCYWVCCCCGCCCSGPITVVVHLPATGYVSGQKIPITCQCDNASEVDVDNITFELRKTVTFRATQPTRETKTEMVVIGTTAVGRVEANDAKTWSKELELPPLPPSNLINCGIIDLDYELHVEVDAPFILSNLTGIIPITLGTIPLALFQLPPPYSDEQPIQDPSMAPTQPVSPASPPNGTGGAIGWNITDNSPDQSALANMPPPTFAESQLRATSILDRQDSTNTLLVDGQEYAPRYPTYTFTPSAPPQNV